MINYYYKFRVKAGLCIQCGEPSKKTRCQKCAAKKKANKQVLKKYRIAHNLCTACGKNTPKINYLTCKACLAKDKKRDSIRKKPVTKQFLIELLKQACLRAEIAPKSILEEFKILLELEGIL